MTKRVDVNVTPQFINGGSIICDVDPPIEHRKGGHIRLPRGDSYILAFRLMPGKPDEIRFKPDQNGKCDAFWSDAQGCPGRAMNVSSYGEPRLIAPDRLEVEINVEQGSDPAAIHYRLNFDDGRSFDPIIIHE